METLTASVQYGDFQGTTAADRSDHNELNDFAKSHGVKGQVLAVSCFSGDDGKHFILALYTGDPTAVSGGKLTVTRHDLQGATVDDLLKLFKRFSVVLQDTSIADGVELQY